MEKRPIYVSVFVCFVLWLCSMGDMVGEDILGWGHFFVGFLLLSNYLMKK